MHIHSRSTSSGAMIDWSGNADSGARAESMSARSSTGFPMGYSGGWPRLGSGSGTGAADWPPLGSSAAFSSSTSSSPPPPPFSRAASAPPDREPTTEASLPFLPYDSRCVRGHCVDSLACTDLGHAGGACIDLPVIRALTPFGFSQHRRAGGPAGTVLPPHAHGVGAFSSGLSSGGFPSQPQPSPPAPRYRPSGGANLYDVLTLAQLQQHTDAATTAAAATTAGGGGSTRGYHPRHHGALPPDTYAGAGGGRRRHRDPPSGLPHVRAQGRGGGGGPGSEYGHSHPYLGGQQPSLHTGMWASELGGGAGNGANLFPAAIAASTLGSSALPQQRRKKLTTLKKKILMVRRRILCMRVNVFWRLVTGCRQ